MRNLILAITVFLLFSCDNLSNNETSSKNTPPTILGTFSQIRVGEKFSFTPDAYDADGDVLFFSIHGKPDWATFDARNGNLSGIPLPQNVGDIYEIVIAVSDGKSSAILGPLNLEVTRPIFSITLDINGIDEYRDMELYLQGCLYVGAYDNCTETIEEILILENGTYSFQSGIETGTNYKLIVEREPGRQNCTLSENEGVMANFDLSIEVNCQADESSALYDLNKIHKIRLIMTSDEWNRFILDSQRARYTTGDAHKNPIFLSSHSEVYRQVDFEYLDENNEVIESLEKVGFKMKGQSGRRWPEYFDVDSNGEQIIKPKRFSFSLKFNEKFDEDEGVYSCIDSNGNPAAVEGHPCYSRVGKNLTEVWENDGRRFMDQKKIFFRFNRDDPSYQRELLSHELLNSTGVPSSRVSHASVELIISGIGELYGKPLPHTYNMGVFQLTEQVDKDFLKRFFGKNGYLFKIGGNADLSRESHASSDCIPYENSIEYENASFCHIGVEKSDPISREDWLGSSVYLNPEVVNSDINNEGAVSQFKPYRPKYDLKTKKDEIQNARFMLQNFMVFLQNGATSEELSAYFDIDGFIKSQALEIVIGAVDHYVRVGNNYYLYFNPLKEKWIYIPNDFDFVFRDSHASTGERPPWANAYQDIATTYVFPEDGKVDWSSRKLGEVNPILWDVIFADESNKHKLYIEIKDILENQLIWEDIEMKLLARDELIRDFITSTDAGNPQGCGFVYDPRAINADIGTQLCDEYDISIKTFINLRKQTLHEELLLRGY